jgi:hypothetical protein
LKQIALATSHYAEQNKDVLPMASYPHTDLSPEQRLGWYVALLPQLDEEPLFKQFNVAQGWESNSNRNAAKRRPRGLLCPAQDETKLSSPLSITTYVGIAGVGLDAPLLPLADRRCGVFGHDRRIKLEDVTDGPAQTMLVIDTSANLGPWSAATSATVRGIDLTDTPLVGEDRPFGRVHRLEKTRFTSIPQTAMTAMLDGSVREINKNVSISTFTAAATIAGGDELGPDW